MEIDKIAILQLQPDDILVLSYGGKISESAHNTIDDQLKESFPGVKCMILDSGMTLQVLKPALRWTSDLPTQDGIYWYKFNKNSIPEVMELNGAWVFDMQSESSTHIDSFKSGEWYGPIEPPKYP